MANGYIERGEIYKVRMDFGVGSEEGSYRPGVVVSNNSLNNTQSTVNVLYLSRRMNRVRPQAETELDTMATGVPSYIMCHQIATIDKSRLSTMMGVLDNSDMRRVEDMLEDIYDLGYTDDVALKEKDREIEARDAVIKEKDEEIARLQAQIVENNKKHEDDVQSYKAENAMWTGLYNKALDMVIDMKLSADLAKRTRPVEPVQPVEQELLAEQKQPEPPKQPEAPKEPETTDSRVDINTCTITKLKNLGFSLPLSKKIVDCRPYKSLSDLKSVPGMKATQYRIMEPKLCCIPVKPSIFVKDGPDLGYEVEPGDEAVPVVEPVAPVEPAAPVEQPEVQKVNINTASAEEIHKALGLSMTVCYSITGVRKREGLYKSVNDLLNVPRFAQSHLDKFGDRMEV